MKVESNYAVLNQVKTRKKGGQVLQSQNFVSSKVFSSKYNLSQDVA